MLVFCLRRGRCQADTGRSSSIGVIDAIIPAMLVPVRVAAAALVLLLLTPDARASAARYVTFSLRGKALTLAIYDPPRAALGTIVMGSGDVGWVGVATSMARFLSDQGF